MVNGSSAEFGGASGEWLDEQVGKDRDSIQLPSNARRRRTLFPGIIGYDDTVIPEINIAIIAGHDMLFLGEKRASEEPADARVGPILGRVHPVFGDFPCPVHEDR